MHKRPWPGCSQPEMALRCRRSGPACPRPCRPGAAQVSASEGDAIKVYNTQTGELQQRLLSKKYGASNIVYTHDPNSVLYSSNKVCCPGS